MPARKEGKLPGPVESVNFDLEYASATLCIQESAIKPGDKIFIIDDLLASGGTVEALTKLIQQMGAVVVGAAFVIELDSLRGREKLAGIKVSSLLHF